MSARFDESTCSSFVSFQIFVDVYLILFSESHFMQRKFSCKENYLIVHKNNNVSRTIVLGAWMKADEKRMNFSGAI